MAVYQDDCPSLATVKRWFNEFQAGRTSVVDTERPGRPSEIDEGRAIKDLEQIVKEERRITTRQLTTRLNISKEHSIHFFDHVASESSAPGLSHDF